MYMSSWEKYMATLSATEARKKLFELLKGASSRHEIYRIRHKDGDAVLMSEKEFESLMETLELLSSPGFREDFEASRNQAEQDATLSFSEVFGEGQ
jgi:antitoxin YefM